MNSLKNNLYFLGPNGTNCEIAAKKFIDKYKIDAILKPCSTICKALTELETDKTAKCVVPIENSIEGIVRETVDNLLYSNAKILSQTIISIRHCLISKGNLKDIKTIISHPQAVSQCQKFINENFGNDLRIIPSNSTSLAVSMLKNLDKTHAAIANEFCAKLYDTDIIEPNISDRSDNQTRFALLGFETFNFPKTRTSIAFSTKNETGALLKILEIFKNYNLNLIYLESRPNKKNIGDYIFFADIDKGVEIISAALDEISTKCDFFKILGSYGIF